MKYSFKPRVVSVSTWSAMSMVLIPSPPSHFHYSPLPYLHECRYFRQVTMPIEILAPSRVFHDFIFLVCIPMETEYSITQLRRAFPVYIFKKDINWGSEAESMGFIVDFHSGSLCISWGVLFLINFTRNVTLPKSIIKYIVYVWIIINGIR